MKEILAQLRLVSALVDLVQDANQVLEVKSGLIVASLDGEIIYMSPGACEIFEHPQDRIAGEKIEALMPERYREPHRRGIERVRKGEPSRVAGVPLSLIGLTGTGKEIGIMLRIELRQAGDLGTVLVARVNHYPGVDRSIMLRIEAGHA